MCCPMMTAWDLHKAWPEADFKVTKMFSVIIFINISFYSTKCMLNTMFTQNVC